FNEGYSIVSKENDEQYRANRPRHIFKTFVTRGISLFLSFGLFVVVYTLLYLGLSKVGDWDNPDMTTKMVIGVFMTVTIAIAIAAVFYIFIAKIICPLRTAEIYDKDNNLLFKIQPLSRFFIFNN